MEAKIAGRRKVLGLHQSNKKTEGSGSSHINQNKTLQVRITVFFRGNGAFVRIKGGSTCLGTKTKSGEQKEA